MATNLFRFKGRFSVSSMTIISYPDMVESFFSLGVVIIEVKQTVSGFNYVGLSEKFFDPIDVGEEIPKYEIKFKVSYEGMERIYHPYFVKK